MGLLRGRSEYFSIGIVPVVLRQFRDHCVHDLVEIYSVYGTSRERVSIFVRRCRGILGDVGVQKTLPVIGMRYSYSITHIKFMGAQSRRATEVHAYLLVRIKGCPVNTAKYFSVNLRIRRLVRRPVVWVKMHFNITSLCFLLPREAHKYRVDGLEV